MMFCLCRALRRASISRIHHFRLAAVVSFVLLCPLLFLYGEDLLWPKQALAFRYFTYPLEDNVSKCVSQLMAGVKPDLHPINIYNTSFLISNATKCLNSKGQKENVELLLIVKSAVKNFDHRSAIRETWGCELCVPNVAIRRVFNLGLVADDALLQHEVENEHRLHGDIVQSDFWDTYYNNTIKTMTGFRWAVENCPNARFILFVDDDMYVSVKNVLRFSKNPCNYTNEPIRGNFPKTLNVALELPKWRDNRHCAANETHSDLFAGYGKFSDIPFRNRNSRWYVSMSEYPFDVFPPYVPAGGFVLSSSALQKMYFTSMYTQHFRLDDIFVGLVAYKAGIRPFHNHNFQFWGKPTNYQNVILVHELKSSDLLEVWKKHYTLQQT